MVLTIFGLKTCDTCRKALKALEAAGHEVSFVDVRASPLSRARIEAFLAAFGDNLVNTRSTTWRGMDETARTAPPVDQLLAQPTLMKRPVIEADSLHLGWGKDVQGALL